MSLGMGSEVFKDSQHPQHVLCLLLMDQDVSSQLAASASCCHAYIPPSKTLTLWNLSQIKLFLLEVAWNMVFCDIL